MATDSMGFHENEQQLTPETRELHRAIVSIQEELEAVDWYQQRIDGSSDEDLKQILAHNRDEEKEHAAMLLEWWRRRDAAFDRVLRTYLFASGNIIEAEEAAEGKTGGTEAKASAPNTLTVGSLMKGGAEGPSHD